MSHPDSSNLKIGYFADGPWAHGAFDLLSSDPRFSIAFICARHSRPDPCLKVKADELGIRFYAPKNVNSSDFLAETLSHGCDIFVSMSFDQILKKELYSSPALGTINCHAGRLPFYRGRNILNWAIINDEKEFGITVHYVDEGVDTGDIILQYLYPIRDEDDYGSLLAAAHRECPIVLFEAMQLIYSGNAKRIPQSSIHPFGSIYSRRRDGDEKIDWSQSSREVFNFIRSLNRPGPMAFTLLEGRAKVRIAKAEIIAEAPRYKCIPGAILAKEEAGFLVKTGDTYVLITEWFSGEKLFVGGRLC